MKFNPVRTVFHSILTAFASLMLLIAGLHASVIVTYNAGVAGNPATAPDPTSAEGGGWTLNNSTAGDANFTWGSVAPDGTTGLNAWRVMDNTTTSGRFLNYSYALTAQQQTNAVLNGWKLSGVFRLQDPVAANAGARTVYLFFGNNVNTRYIAFFDIQASGALDVNFQGTGGGTVVLTTNVTEAAAYNTHEFVFDPATQKVTYRFNGTVMLTNWSGTTGVFNGVKWGTESSGGRGDSYWNLVRYEIMDPPPAPVVVQDPQSAIKNVGESVAFNAVFTNLVLGYQWFKDGTAIPGATASVYSIPFLTVLDSADYVCRATNNVGFADTAPATLMVMPDYVAPFVSNATMSIFASRMRVHFSEPVGTNSATDLANYSFQDAALAVTNAVMFDRFTVDLFVSPVPAMGSNYVLIINNVLDYADNPVASNTRVEVTAPKGFPHMDSLIAAFNGSQTRNHSVDGVTWLDQSGNENHAESYSDVTNRRPTLISTNLNGYNTLSFYRPSQQALTINGPASTGFNASNYTWFIVAKPTNVAGFNPNLLRHSSTFSFAAWGSFMFGGNASTSNQPAFTSNGRKPAGAAIEAVAFPIYPGNWMICEGYLNGDIGEIYSRVETPSSNMVVLATNSSATPVGYGAPLLTWIGRSPGTATDAFDGEMAEVLVYSGALSDVRRADIETYLRDKYFPVQTPVVSIRRNGSETLVEFTGTLLKGDDALSVSNVVPGATSPLVLTNGAPTQFYRSRVP